MNNIMSIDSYKQQKSNDVPRNSKIFKEFVESKGFSLLTVKKLLNKYGTTKYDKYISDDGNWIVPNIDKYLGQRDYHGADDGKRTPGEKQLDCIVGNIQEILFCVKSGKVLSTNDNATNDDVHNDYKITRIPDLIYNKNNYSVEFKMKGGYTYNNKVINDSNIKKLVYYNHRDSKFKKEIENGKVFLVYYYDLNKLFFLSKKNFNKSFFYNKTEDKYGKNWDVIVIDADDDNISIHFDMFDRKIYKKEIEELIDRNLDRED